MIALATEIAAVLRCERPVPRLHSTGRTYSGKIRTPRNAVAFPPDAQDCLHAPFRLSGLLGWALRASSPFGSE